MQIVNAIVQIELQLLDRLYGLGRRRLIIPVAKALSHSGDGYLHAGVMSLLWLNHASHVEQFFLTLALALLIERSLYWVLKNTLKRKRPADFLSDFSSIINASDQFSFPSGHSSGAFLLATCLCLVYGGLSAVVLLWACGVALSRVVLGVHFPGDIVAGGLMGSTIAWCSYSMLSIQ